MVSIITFKNMGTESIRKPIYLGVIIVTIVIALHAAASYFGWYWIFRWFDIPMHILGGVFAGYLGMVIYMFRTGRKNPSLWIPLLTALIVGIAWEFLENAYGVSGLNAVYRFDTIKDIIDDMMGGVISLALWDFFIYKKQPQK